MNDARNWVRTLSAALRRAGHDGLLSFLRAHPSTPWAALPSLLGVRVPPLCLPLYALDEAVRDEALPFFARDDLARRIAAELPGGWSSTPAARRRLQRAVVGRERLPDDALERVASHFGLLLVVEPLPVGWLPHGGDDAVLLRLWRLAEQVRPLATLVAPGG